MDNRRRLAGAKGACNDADYGGGLLVAERLLKDPVAATALVRQRAPEPAPVDQTEE